MAVNTHDLQAGQRSGTLVNADGVFNGNAELVFLEAGRNVRVRARINIGIDAQRHRRHLAQTTGHSTDTVQLSI